mmetsp:Transcript_17482/g.24301  ORF Transcript_17482/g.24301 Transcript_17482/m.24301 type:complete len:108 (-) Transcript_17482:430-753(-)
MSPRSSYFVDTASWSEPRVMTIGRIQGLNVDIFNDSETQGWNCSSFGYKSIGDSVPEVITTLPNLLKTGAIANEESKHANWITGSTAPGIDEAFGSMIIANLATPSE